LSRFFHKRFFICVSIPVLVISLVIKEHHFLCAAAADVGWFEEHGFVLSGKLVGRWVHFKKQPLHASF